MSGDESNGPVDEDTVEDFEVDEVELSDDEGNTVTFAMLLVIEIDGIEYAALSPKDQLEDDDNDEPDVYLFVYETYEEDEGFVESFGPIEDEETFDKVKDYVSKQLEVWAGA